MAIPASRRERDAALGLLWTLVRTDFKTRYHGSFGGFVWVLLKPAALFAVLLAIFSLVFAQSRNYSVNLVIGLFLWTFFSEATRSAVVSLHSKGFLVARSRIPPWIVVASSVSNAALSGLVFFVLIVSYALYIGTLGITGFLALALYALAFLALCVGIGLALSPLFLYYRDLNQIWDLILEAGFFVAPIIWPIDIIPERFHIYFYAWLPTTVIQYARRILVAGEIPSLRAAALLLAAVAVVVIVGALIFSKLARRSLERL